MAKPHSFPNGATCCGGIPYCVRCGLLWLKNAVTKKALSKPCPGSGDDE